MAFIPLPSGVKIEIKCRKGGAPNINVVWGIVSVTVDLGKLQEIALAVEDWWDTHMQPLMSGSLSFEGVTVTDWSEEAGLQYDYDLITPLTGTASGTDTPSNVAAVTTFLTPYSGRSFRGRVYNPGLTDAQITTNTLGTVYVASMLTAWVNFGIAMDDINVAHVVASFVHDNAPRTTAVGTPIITYSMNNVVDTQRRRIPKVNN